MLLGKHFAPRERGKRRGESSVFIHDVLDKEYLEYMHEAQAF